MLSDKKILITGATGQVARPVAEKLAADNEVWCASRFSNPALRDELEALGMIARPWTLGENDFSMLPTDFTHVLHSALVNVQDHEQAIETNVVGAAMLMNHCRAAKAFVYVS